MYQTHKTYIKPDYTIAELICENPTLLLMMEHFNLDFCVQDKTVKQICLENGVELQLFLVIGNLYNGFFPGKEDIKTITDLMGIIHFLKRSHQFYKNDKYPEIKKLIAELMDNHDCEAIQPIEEFFNSYFNEVIEHLEYEDKIAFPYFFQLITINERNEPSQFSAYLYREHHSDIETKLNDLKNLLLKHIGLKDNLTVRRNLITALFELEFDLQIHSIIEEKVLLPLVFQIESNLVK